MSKETRISDFIEKTKDPDYPMVNPFTLTLYGKWKDGWHQKYITTYSGNDKHLFYKILIEDNKIIEAWRREDGKLIQVR